MRKIKIKKLPLGDYVLFSAIISLGIILDQITKWLTVKFLEIGESVQVIKYVVNFTYVQNTGAAFGSFKDNRWIFMITSTVMILAIGLYLYLGFSDNKLYSVSLSMIVAGGIGNMIDRIALGYVIDFLDFSQIYFPFVFNVADSFVCVGAGILALAVILDIKNEAKELKKKKKDEEQ